MKPIMLVFAALVVGTGYSSAQVVSGPITNTANGHHYYLLSGTNWNAAEAQAVSLGGHLATIRSADENAWVYSTFQPYFGTEDFFIGLTDRGHEGSFTWVSGETNRYRNWAAGEPNNAGGNEDRVAMKAENGRWNDVPGTANGHHGIVEILRPQTNDLPRVTIRRVAGGGAVEISWVSRTNHLYQVLSAPALPTQSWSSFGPYLHGDGAETRVSDTTDHSRQFYVVHRVE